MKTLSMKNTNEYRTAVMELVLVIGSKARRISQLKEELAELEKENKWVHGQLAERTQQNLILKNDLKDLSTEFTRWKNGKAETKKKN